MYPTSRSLTEALGQSRIDHLRREAQLYSRARQARASRRSAKSGSTGR
jgi:hypothetical protein